MAECELWRNKWFLLTYCQKMNWGSLPEAAERFSAHRIGSGGFRSGAHFFLQPDLFYVGALREERSSYHPVHMDTFHIAEILKQLI